MRTSGLVLDLYDDFQGEVLRSIYPSREEIPETVKTAHPLSSVEREKLPDDAFALVLLNGEQKLRKFACIDEGNTSLSVDYFLKTGHKLPIEAQKTAAANLVTACGWYDIKVPEALEKVAFLGAAMNVLTLAPTVTGAAHEMKERLDQNSMAGGRVLTESDRNQMKMMKSAEVVGTTDMPISVDSSRKVEPSKTVINKSAASVDPETNESVQHKEQPEKLPQSKALRPHVDVSNKEPPKVITKKEAAAYALPSEKKYPLDNYAQVKAAASYFDEYGKRFSPESRHEYCVNLVKRASALGIPVSAEAQKYGSETYAPEFELKVAHQVRRDLVSHIEGAVDVLDGLFQKTAEIDPALFCATLSEFDKSTHLDFNYDNGVPDPFWSTYGTKIAEEWSEVIGNDMVTEADLRRLAKIGQRALKTTFSEDFAVDFRKDPVGIFKSLPLDQKKIVMRMAGDNGGPGIELLA